MPQNQFITDGTTFINPLGLAFTVLMGILLCVLPRRYALVPVIALMCYMTMGMRVIFAGMNFTMLRILLLFGWLRVVTRGELTKIRVNKMDRTMIWFAVISVLSYTVLWGTGDAFKYKLGLAYNVLGFYFLFRILLKDADDLLRVFKIYAYLVAPLAALMLVEKASGVNSFAAFGGVTPITAVRDGVLRCQGPFAHPILAGTFGATMAPLFLGLWCRRERFVAAIGLASAVAITLVSGSSGPVLALACGIVAMAMWRVRRYMRLVRWATAVALIFLHLTMKAPVWFLIARIDIFSGSTGYHRAYLIDRAIANFSGWWFVGTKSTAAWADADAGLFDVTSQYLVYAADGGLITMTLFIATIVIGFKYAGRYTHLPEAGGDSGFLLCAWSLGAALFAHTMNFLSVSYFDQNVVCWYLLLAMLATLPALGLAPRPAAQGAQIERVERISVDFTEDPFANRFDPMLFD